ncbi:MAG: choice-of-anchor tandem repeat GloVer-containing protein [Candidatus Korobacteraceae bacterium]
MRGKGIPIAMRALAICTVTLLVTSAWGGTESVPYSFNPRGRDGAFPQASLIGDAHGNFYGATSEGGSDNVGTVFALTPNGSGGWTEKVLHNFANNGTDGTFPYAGLIFDAAGNLYGTTSEGGDYNEGTVFKMMPNGSGGWTEKKLHNFGINGTDGMYPYAGLIFDKNGILYGTTYYGGDSGLGTVFEMTPNGSGGWTEKKLHNFNPYNGDGYEPYAGLIFDAAGNLYGTTGYGGDYNEGTVFEMAPNGSGGWTEKKLHNFNNDGTDGTQPYAGLILDGGGNLYGTTYTGGDYGVGTVFEVSPDGSGGWTEKKLHNFGLYGTDGTSPNASLIFDAAGNLYGTTYLGGIHGWGTVFEMMPKQGGGWTELVLHSFNLAGTAAANPLASLLIDTAGNLYGTTLNGGLHSVGTVFEMKPGQAGGWTETLLYSFNFNGTDGATPALAGLIGDNASNGYGTTSLGGTYDGGTVVEFLPNGEGGYTEEVLYNFGKGTDASNPEAGLVFDNAGNLYGTTLIGGIHNYGTIFELSPNGSGGWTEQVLHSFNHDGSDGFHPYDALIFDAAGNLYGTTFRGGTHNDGTVFELSPNGSGGWTEQVLHSFNLNGGADGALPFAGLIFDSAGNLYGTTYEGGVYYTGGTVFELSPNGSGGWTEQVLYSFNENGTDGTNPYAGLIFNNTDGNLSGTTQYGGAFGDGAVFELTFNGFGWQDQLLHSFDGTDGAFPQAALNGPGAFPQAALNGRHSSSAVLYGTTYAGGVNNLGTVFELTPTQGGSWIETVLHNFSPTGGDGSYPQGSVIGDDSGNLYGMTSAGGTYNSGAAWEITP